MKRLALFSLLSVLALAAGCAHSPSSDGDQALADLNQQSATSGTSNDGSVDATQAQDASGAEEVAAAPSEPPVVSGSVPAQAPVADTPAYSQPPKHRTRRHKHKKLAHRRHKHGKRVAKKKHHKHHDAAE